MELIAAFLLGLGSAPHCVAMCGGIASALMLGSQQQAAMVNTQGTTLITSDRRSASGLNDAWLLGTGKLLGYASLGLLAGTGGVLLTGLHQSAFGVLRFVAGILMILMGLYTAGWWLGLTRFEKLAFRLWQPLLSRFRNLRLITVRSKLSAGVLWGLLPCGIVYTALSMALTAGSVLKGVLIMLMFGLGTMPFVLATGGIMQLSTRWLRKSPVRITLGLILISFGITSLMMAMH